MIIKLYRPYVITCGTCKQPAVRKDPGSWSTAALTTSPPGHNHDGNRQTETVYCQQGHRTHVSYYSQCHCGWTRGGPNNSDIRDALKKLGTLRPV